ncbi:phosphate transporter (Pho88) [Cystobasidiomycetes sp. EMM_F5]
MGFMHLKMGYTQPLLIQSILPMKSLYDNPIIQVITAFYDAKIRLLTFRLIQLHIFGRPAVDKLARPFKASGGLMAALSEATNASNPATPVPVASQPAVAGSAKITEITDDDDAEPKKSK